MRLWRARFRGMRPAFARGARCRWECANLRNWFCLSYWPFPVATARRVHDERAPTGLVELRGDLVAPNDVFPFGLLAAQPLEQERLRHALPRFPVCGQSNMHPGGAFEGKYFDHVRPLCCECGT